MSMLQEPLLFAKIYILVLKSDPFGKSLLIYRLVVQLQHRLLPDLQSNRSPSPTKASRVYAIAGPAPGTDM